MLIPGRHYRAEETLPHRGRMLLLDEISGYGEDWLSAIVRIRADTLLAEAGGVPAWAGIEYMAQAAAAYAGIERLQKGQTPTIGFLLGTRRYESIRPWFAIGAELQIRAQIMLRDANDLAVFDCEIHHNGQRVAWADIKAYRPEDAEKFLGT